MIRAYFLGGNSITERHHDDGDVLAVRHITRRGVKAEGEN